MALVLSRSGHLQCGWTDRTHKGGEGEPKKLKRVRHSGRKDAEIVSRIRRQQKIRIEQQEKNTAHPLAASSREQESETGDDNEERGVYC